MTELHYLGIAYMAIWTLIGFLGVILFRRVKQNETNLSDLQERINKS